MPGELEIGSSCAQDTFALGKRLGQILRPGEAVGLIGELGSGKTVFISGVCAELGCTSLVTSPTFTLMHRYTGKIPIFHFDCFRLKNARELAGIGFDEIVSSGENLVLVEWADHLRGFFDDWTFEIQFFFSAEAEGQRLLLFRTQQEKRLNALSSNLSESWSKTS